MPEWHPDDDALLALDADAETGVEHIPTGRSPYFLEFRRLVHRLLDAARRANDLRVYRDGELSVGVRRGRCVLANAPIQFPGAAGIELDDDATTHLWLDPAGDVQTGEALPADRTAFLPLARIVTEAGAIADLTDLRGEAYLAVTDLPLLGVSAAAEDINRALGGIAPAVDAEALNALAAGPLSTADDHHRHLQVLTEQDAETAYRLINQSAGGDATILLRFDVPARLPGPIDLMPDIDTGSLRQRHLGESYALLGAAHAAHVHAGDLLDSDAGRLIGPVPIDGAVSDVVLSLGQNIESDMSTDGVSATVKVNGTALTSTDPKITEADGPGFRSTAQGDGTEAIVSSSVADVKKGDILTVDLNLTAEGNTSVEAADIAVLIVIRASAPE